MLSLYKSTGRSQPNHIQDFNNLEELKKYIIFILEKTDGLSKEQAIALVEFGIPVKWTNSAYITAKELEHSVEYKSDCGGLYYQIVK